MCGVRRSQDFPSIPFFIDFKRKRFLPCGLFMVLEISRACFDMLLLEL